MESAGTRPLDAMQMLLAQLSRIERNIEALPALLARLDALTESTRQLEQQWRETARELALRDDSQQRMIADLGLRQSELMAALTAVSGTVQEQKNYQVDIGRRVVVLERQIEVAMDAHQVLNRRVSGIEAKPGANEFSQWRPILAQVASVIATVQEWLPWWRGIRWAAGIAGGLLVTLIVAGIFWAIIQSGGRLP